MKHNFIIISLFVFHFFIHSLQWLLLLLSYRINIFWFLFFLLSGSSLVFASVSWTHLGLLIDILKFLDLCLWHWTLRITILVLHGKIKVMLIKDHAFTFSTMNELCFNFLIQLSDVCKIDFCCVLRILVRTEIVWNILWCVEHILVDNNWSLLSVPWHACFFLFLSLNWINMTFFIWFLILFIQSVKVRLFFLSFQKNLSWLLIFISLTWEITATSIINVLIKLANHILHFSINLYVTNYFTVFLLF